MNLCSKNQWGEHKYAVDAVFETLTDVMFRQTAPGMVIQCGNVWKIGLCRVHGDSRGGISGIRIDWTLWKWFFPKERRASSANQPFVVDLSPECLLSLDATNCTQSLPLFPPNVLAVTHSLSQQWKEQCIFVFLSNLILCTYKHQTK